MHAVSSSPLSIPTPYPPHCYEHQKNHRSDIQFLIKEINVTHKNNTNSTTLPATINFQNKQPFNSNFMFLLSSLSLMNITCVEPTCD